MINNSNHLLFALNPSFLPKEVNDARFAGMNTAEWVGLVLFIGISYAAGWLLHWLITWIGKMIATRTHVAWDDDLLKIISRPLRFFLTLFVFSQLIIWLDLGEDRADIYEFLHSFISCLIAAVIVWLSLRLLAFGTDIAEKYLVKDIAGTSQARAIHTQVSVVKGIARFLLIVVGVAVALMQFEVARALGYSMLASAGIATAAIGFASQRSIATIFAGIQIAFTQTIRIDDVVVVEGEWGRIEDIRLTYVIVRIWDLRRLIVPVTYFTDKPIENWTAKSPEILGTVYLYTDYTISLDDIRAELKRILENEGKEYWDEKVSGAIVTNLTAQHVEVRCLVSAKDSSDIWNLRCTIREKMLEWLQKQGKTHIPRQRVQAEADPDNPNGAMVMLAPQGDKVTR